MVGRHSLSGAEIVPAAVLPAAGRWVALTKRLGRHAGRPLARAYRTPRPAYRSVTSRKPAELAELSLRSLRGAVTCEISRVNLMRTVDAHRRKDVGAFPDLMTRALEIIAHGLAASA